MALAAGFLLLSFVPGLSAVAAGIGDLPGRPNDALAIALVVLHCLPLAVRTIRPTLCLAVVGLSFGVHQAFAYPPAFASLALYVALYSAGAHGRRPWAAADAIGADRVGIRLSPGGQVQDIVEDDMPALYSALLKALPDIAYIHVLATADDEVLMGLRKAWPTTFILNPGGQIGPHESTQEQGEHWLANGADLISYGRAYLGNPDLVERFRLGLPLISTDRETWFQTEQGYVDYPSHQH